MSVEADLYSRTVTRSTGPRGRKDTQAARGGAQ